MKKEPNIKYEKIIQKYKNTNYYITRFKKTKNKQDSNTYCNIKKKTEKRIMTSRINIPQNV